jgi:hypothetical protein
VTTDRAFWYISSNGDKTIRKVDDRANQFGRLVVPQYARGGHVGPASYYDGWLYVAIEGPTSVFKPTFPLARRSHIRSRWRTTTLHGAR